MEKLQPTPEKYFEPLNPEIITGHDYVIPTIEALGTGRGFRISGLHLQKNWQDKLNPIGPDYQRNLISYLNERLEDFKLPLGNISFDKNGRLREIYISAMMTCPTYGLKPTHFHLMLGNINLVKLIIYSRLLPFKMCCLNT